MSDYETLTESERRQIAEILERRANDIATFESAVKRHMPPNVQEYEFPGSVELALTREIQRLRKLAAKIKPVSKEEEEEE